MGEEWVEKWRMEEGKEKGKKGELLKKRGREGRKGGVLGRESENLNYVRQGSQSLVVNMLWSEPS